ncbi:MAG: signal peptidase I [Dermatophilus congolensis]|nr:signal peptidase I [Dermatophilus congolensis]
MSSSATPPNEPQGGTGGSDATGQATASGNGEGQPGGGFMRALWAFVRELVIIVVFALVISFVVKTWLLQSFYIPSGSMMNTLVKDDRVVVSKLSPSPFEIERGDIVVFEDPGGWLPLDHTLPESSGLSKVLTWVGVLPEDEGNHLIKRVIGLPGDKVTCCTADGRLTVNGTPIDEPYLFPGAPPSSRTFDITVPDDGLWVMGDNRDHSSDSRFHDAPGNNGTEGSIPLSGVVGRSFAVIWPLNRATWLNGGGDAFANVPPAVAGAMAATETGAGVPVMSGLPGPKATIGTVSR